LSAEVEFQRALVLSYDEFGHRHPLYSKAESNLRQIYHLQYLDKLEFTKELAENHKAHVQRLRGLIEKADYYSKLEDDHANAAKNTRQVIYLKSKAQNLAEQTRNALKLRNRLNQWQELEKQLETISDLSHSMRRDQSTEYLALKGVKDVGILGRSSEDKIKKEKRASAANTLLSKLGTPERKGPNEEGDEVKPEEPPKIRISMNGSPPPRLSSHLLVGVADWRYSNRLDPYFGEELHVHETSVDSLVRASRKEYGLVAKSAQARIRSGKCDPTDEHLFRASLGQLKAHPRINDFLADVTVENPETCVVGEPFPIKFSYVHKKQRDRLHCPGDWLGIFSVSQDKEETLVCWHEVPELLNEYTFTVDKSAIKEEGEYFAAYFVNGSDKPLGKSKIFRPKFVFAKVEITAARDAKDSDSIKIGSDGVVSVICGVSCVVSFDIMHSEGYLHSHNDTVGLIKCDKHGIPEVKDVNEEGWWSLTKKAAVKVVKVPRETNSGKLILEHGCSLPGYYRLMFFAHEQGNRVCGTSGCIRAVRDFGEADIWKKKKKKNRLFRIYISTRWDMEAEKKTWREVIVPMLRLYCDDRFIDFAYVECAIPNGNIAWQGGDEAISRMLHGIKYCAPVFVCCLGEMLSLNVNRKSMSADFKEEMITDFPMLSSMVFSDDVRVIPTTTELEIAEALFVPSMEEAMRREDAEDGVVEIESAADHTFFFNRHPSLRSINFPEYIHNFKGVNTISNIRKRKGDLKEILGKIEEKTTSVRPMPAKYANMDELTDMMLTAIKGSIESIWPSASAPVFLDRFAIETEIAMEFLRCGYVRHLDRFVYNSDHKDNMSNPTSDGDNRGDRGMGVITYRPIIEKAMQGSVGMHLPARTRAVLQGKKNRPLAFYEILEKHCDSVNNTVMVVVDYPNCGVTLKLSNFIHGYLKAHRGEISLPQWGVCRNRGLIKRYFKTVSVKIGGSTTDLLVKTKKEKSKGVMRPCLVLYVDLRRPSHRWKVGNMCKYILRELKRTFHIEMEIPDVDADCVSVLGTWLEDVAIHGDAIIVLDGIDQVDSEKEEDPFFFLPNEVPSCIRFIFSCHATSRAYVALTTNYNKKDALIIKRKSNMGEEEKAKLFHGVAKHLGFAASLDSVLPLLSSERTNTVGYLRCAMEELFYRGMFQGAGVYNEDKKWGLWDTSSGSNLDPDCCGGKLVRDGIAETCTNIVETCDNRFAIYESRLRRLMDTCPFFEISICCIRLARRGLGEDELRRILYGKKSAKMEWRRQEKLKAVVEVEAEEGGEEEKKEGAGAAGEEAAEEITTRKEEKAEGVPEANREVMVTTADIIFLLERLEEVCMSCFGKFTLANMEIQNAIDKVMLSKHAQPGDSGGGGRKGKESNADTWKGFYLQVMIDMFNKSLVSFRKAEELPFLAKYYAKTINPKKDAKKVAKWKENILRMVLEVDMFFRLSDEMLIDDLVRCLHFCHSTPSQVVSMLKANLEIYFGLGNLKKNFGYKYETLTQKNIGVNLHHFRINGGKILHSMSNFCLKHLHNVTKEAEEMAECALILNFTGKKFPVPGEGPRTHGWNTFPLDLRMAIDTLILLSEICIKRVRICHARLTKKEAKTQKVMGGALLSGQNKGDQLVKAMHMNQKEFKATLGADGDPEKSDGIDPIAIKQKLEFLSKHIAQMEEIGLDDESIDSLQVFDKNMDAFEEIYIELPQARQYRGKKLRSTTWLHNQGDDRLQPLQELGEYRKRDD